MCSNDLLAPGEISTPQGITIREAPDEPCKNIMEDLLIKPFEDRRYMKLEKELQYAMFDVRDYRRRLRHEEKRGDKLIKECNERIAGIRYFWKPKIYNEGTRGGKILKKAMQS